VEWRHLDNLELKSRNKIAYFIMRESFWVVNISPKQILLEDLATSIKPFTTVNLLDPRHYKYTLEQLNKSKESGSIYKKGLFIKVRECAPPPTPIDMSKLIDKASSMPSREKSIFVIEEKEYEELYVGDSEEQERKKIDEQIAKEHADLEDEDQPQPSKKV